MIDISSKHHPEYKGKMRQLVQHGRPGMQAPFDMAPLSIDGVPYFGLSVVAEGAGMPIRNISCAQVDYLFKPEEYQPAMRALPVELPILYLRKNGRYIVLFGSVPYAGAFRARVIHKKALERCAAGPALEKMKEIKEKYGSPKGPEAAKADLSGPEAQSQIAMANHPTPATQWDGENLLEDVRQELWEARQKLQDQRAEQLKAPAREPFQKLPHLDQVNDAHDIQQFPGARSLDPKTSPGAY